MSRMTDQIGRVLSGRYRLIAPLGTGASAQVYLADDVRLRRRVAVKLLHAALADDESFLRRFRAEAQAAAALNHPHILSVYDWGDHEGTPYLVTEHLAGGSLRSLLDGGHRLTPSQALLVGLEACRALDVAHRRGFVHRDIKPANLLFGDDARLRVADFGLARAIAEAAWTEPQGAVLGTARYASPEQAKGERVDGRADVYSLALVLVEAVTGKVPFAADTTIATLMGRVGNALVVPDELGPLRRPLERAGLPEPEDRPEAGELAVSLMACAERLPRPEPLPLVAPGTVPAGPGNDPTSLGASGGSTFADPGELDELTTVTPLPGAAREDDADATTVLGAAAADATVAGAPTPLATPLDDDEGDGDGDLDGPRRRRRWPVVVLTVLLAAALGGAAVWGFQSARTPTYDVPVLAGIQEDEARRLVDDNGWRIDVRQVREDGTEPGQITRTDPVAGESLAEGGTLVLYVSLGNTLAPVPTDLVGAPVEEAVAAVEGAGFVPVTAEDFSEDVEAGIVLAVEDDLPAELPRGSEVALVVSAGPEPRTVPTDLAGQPLDGATEALAALGLEAAPTEAFSDSVEAGLVIEVPEAGNQVARGSSVEVVVSRGPDVVTVPDVAGRSLDDAADALEAAGLEPGQVFGPARGDVAFTDPESGSTVRRGTTVDITLRRR
jgi:eukaryotic-like serine/threonine-protein kinase